jgi:hypothetical protein
MSRHAWLGKSREELLEIFVNAQMTPQHPDSISILTILEQRTAEDQLRAAGENAKVVSIWQDYDPSNRRIILHAVVGWNPGGIRIREKRDAGVDVDSLKTVTMRCPGRGCSASAARGEPSSACEAQGVARASPTGPDAPARPPSGDGGSRAPRPSEHRRTGEPRRRERGTRARDATSRPPSG